MKRFTLSIMDPLHTEAVATAKASGYSLKDLLIKGLKLALIVLGAPKGSELVLREPKASGGKETKIILI